MKRRTKVVASVITCIMSICMMVFGVYAASSPSVTIGGQVSYSARDAKVLVRGKVNGAKDFETVDYPAAMVSTNTVTATKVVDQSTTYLDYTAGTSNDTTDDLSPWHIGKLEFYEDSTGVRSIVINFELTNLSTYPVKATITFGKTEKELQDANVIRTASATSAYLVQNGGKTEVTVIYKVKNDSKGVKSDDLLGMSIQFEKTAANAPNNSISKINENNGKVTMGKVSSSSTVEDVEWKCFAYSTDGITWQMSNGDIPTNAKYGYFLLDTYVESLNVPFLNSNKCAQNSSDNEWYHVETGLTNVYANDYYYSDIRQTLKGLETTLSINTNSDIYKAITARTIEDLYKNNVYFSSKYLDQTAPTDANMTDEDMFWLMSREEAITYFSNADALKYLNESSGVWYWLRSPHRSYSKRVSDITSTGLYDTGYNGAGVGSVRVSARAAFKLRLA